jgi:hypothetical protein
MLAASTSRNRNSRLPCLLIPPIHCLPLDECS